jgi:chemotaxis response regulator CheB
MRPIRILIVDDSTTIRAMLEEVLGRERDFELVGSAPDADTASKMIRQHWPDVTTIDVEMPGRDGLSLLEQVREATRVVMLTSHPEALEAAFEQGAYAFFDKGRILQDSKKLIAIIRATAAGNYTGVPRRARQAEAEGEDEAATPTI